MQDEDGILLEESNVVEKSNAILILVLDSYVVLINCILQPTTMEASSSLAQPDDTGMYNGWGPGYRNYRMGTSSKGIEASNSLLSDCTVSTSTHDYFCVDRAYSQNAAVSDRKAEIVLPQEYNFMRCLEDQSSYTCSRNDHQLDLDCSLTLGTPATKMHQKVRLPADFQKKLDWKQSPKANEGFATHVLFSEDAVHKDNRELYGQTSNDRLLPDLCLQVQSSRQEERIDWIDSRLRYNLEKASFDLQWNNPLKKVEGVMKFYDVQDRNCAQNCMKASNPTRPCGLRICSRCETTKTPLWRNGPQGPKSLCNACGIRYKKEERRAGNVAKNSEISSINNHPPRSNRKIVSLKQKNPIEWLLSAGNVMEEPGLLLPSAAKKTRVTYIHEKHKEIYRVDNHPNQMFLAQTKCSLVLASPSAL